MNPTNKKSPGARGIPQPFNRQAAHAPQFKPVVAQLKTGVSAQSVKRPIAPPVYRPQSKPNAVQQKSSTPPTAPRAYRPQPLPRVLQAKNQETKQSRLRVETKRPDAPSVYRPQSKPSGLQQQMAPAIRMNSHPAAPPAYRPQPLPKTLQPMRRTSPSVNNSKGIPVAPLVYRPQATSQATKGSGPVTRTVNSTRRPGVAAAVRQAAVPAKALPDPQHLAQPKQPAAFIPARFKPFRVAQAKSVAHSHTSRLIVQMRGNGVIQMYCATCNSLGEDAEHSAKNCPYLLLDEGDDNLSEKKKNKKVKEKVKQKQQDDQAEKKLEKQQAKEVGKQAAKEKKEKEEDDKLNLGENLAVAKVTPQPGNQVGDLNNISKTNYPDVFLQTFLNIVAGNGGVIVTTQPVILSHNQGQAKETWEGTVSLGQHYVVVHYHPRAAIVQGALSGESRVHVKGDRGSATHKYISPETLDTLNLPRDLVVQ